MAYQVGVYRTSGGDQQNVDSSGRILINSGGEIDIVSGGRLEIAGTAFITSGGNVSLLALTSGDVDFPGNLTLSSGLNATTGTFTGNITGSANLTLTSGLNATTGSFTSGVTIGQNLTITSGLNATTGTFTGNITGAGNLTLTSGLNASTGTFTGAASFTNNFIWASVAAASSGSTGFGSYGFTQIWSCGVSTGTVFTMPAAAAAGVQKYLSCIASTSTAPAVVTIADTLINGSAGITFSTGSVAEPQWLHLVAENTTNWFVVGKSTGVAIA